MSEKKVLNKKRLSSSLARTCDSLDQAHVEKALDVILDEMSTALVCGDRIEIRGFGSMNVRKREKSIARNPKNGESVATNDRGFLYFRASKDLIKSLNS